MSATDMTFEELKQRWPDGIVMWVDDITRWRRGVVLHAPRPDFLGRVKVIVREEGELQNNFYVVPGYDGLTDEEYTRRLLTT